MSFGTQPCAMDRCMRCRSRWTWRFTGDWEIERMAPRRASIKWPLKKADRHRDTAFIARFSHALLGASPLFHTGGWETGRMGRRPALSSEPAGWHAQYGLD